MGNKEPEFKALSWVEAVLSTSCTLDAQESLVLLCLVRHAHQNTDERQVAGSCFPGMGTIASECRVSRRKVVMALDELRRRGIISSELQQYGKGFASNHYQLALTPPTSALSAPHAKPSPGAHGAPASAPHAPPVVHPMHQGSAPGAHKLLSELLSSTAQVTAQGRKRPAAPMKDGKPHKARQQEISPDWRPTEAHREFAATHGLALDLEVTAFRGHFDGRKVASANGRFATWLANQAKWNRDRAAASGSRRGAIAVQRGVFDESMLRGRSPDWLDGTGK